MFLKDKRKKKFIQITYIALCLKTFTQGCKGNLFLTATKGVHIFFIFLFYSKRFFIERGKWNNVSKTFLGVFLLRHINVL